MRNNSTGIEQLKISVGKFTSDQSGSRPMILDASPQDEYLQWIHFDETDFSVSPGEWKTLTFSFSPPETAALSYFYSLQVSRATNGRAGDGQTQITGVPTILLLANVRSPYAKRELELESFTVSRSFLEYLNQDFTVRIKNTGNIYAVPSGNVFIDTTGKKDLAVLSLNPNQSSILPQSSREFTLHWDDGFPRFVTDTDEKGNSRRRLEWDFSKAHLFRIGRFTAHLILVYDNGERDIPIESFVSFWIIPWKLIGLGLLIALFTTIGLRSVVRSLLVSVRSYIASRSKQLP